VRCTCSPASDATPLAADADRLRAEGASVIFLAIDGRLAGLLAVNDPIIVAGVLYPFFGILLSPLIAALAMSLSSVSVVGNALPLRSA
jgi:cation transport ATPase